MVIRSTVISYKTYFLKLDSSKQNSNLSQMIPYNMHYKTLLKAINKTILRDEIVIHARKYNHRIILYLVRQTFVTLIKTCIALFG